MKIILFLILCVSLARISVSETLLPTEKWEPFSKLTCEQVLSDPLNFGYEKVYRALKVSLNQPFSGIGQTIETMTASGNESFQRIAISLSPQLADVYPDQRSSLIESVTSMLDEPNSEVRIASIRAIGQMRVDSASVAFIQIASTDPVPSVRAVAIHALGLLKEKNAVPLFQENLHNPDEKIRHNALVALGVTGEQDLAEKIIPFLDDPSTLVRMAACDALGQFRNPIAFDPLMQKTHDPNINVSICAIYAVCRFDWNERTWSLLKKLLSSTDNAIRYQVIGLVGSYNHPNSVDIIAKIVRDDRGDRETTYETTIRQLATSSLWQMKYDKSISVLANVYNDTKYDVRRAAILTLESLCKDETIGTQALKTLKTYLHHDDSKTRINAQEALDRLSALKKDDDNADQ